MTAEARYDEPGSAAFAGWTGLMAGIALAVAVVVVAIAWVSRDQSPRPGAPHKRSTDAPRQPVGGLRRGAGSSDPTPGVSNDSNSRSGNSNSSNSSNSGTTH